MADSPAFDTNCVTFTNVTVATSGGHQFYEFSVPAGVLASLAKIRRLGEDVDGVQRRSRSSHVREIGKAMIAGAPFPDNITVNLSGDWMVDDGDRMIVGGNGAHFEVIDGQHRVLALRALLNANRADVVARYSFHVVAVLNATDGMRHQLFLVQDKRLHIESSHALELRAATGEFKNETEERCYSLMRRLNTDDISPFKGRLIFGDAKDGQGKMQLKEGTFAVRSLLNQLRPILSATGKSPVSHLTFERRANLVLDLFIAAQGQYRNFMNPEHVLGQPIGFTALLALLAVDGEFHVRAARFKQPGETGYELQHLRRIFEICGRFMWKARSERLNNSTKSPVGIAKRFNEFLRERADDHVDGDKI